ncbi:MAG: HEAT repeat domain-containing protein, partial [Thermodesulfobacteriota bacterium]
AQQLILLGEYRLATWVYTQLQQARTRISDDSRQAHPPAKPLSPGVTDGIIEDLKSENRSRQQEAYQMLSSMGAGIAPLLTEIIQQEDNLRVRRLAADLLKGCGPDAIDRVKQLITGASRPDERARILDVYDSLVPDITAELAYVFSDPNEAVRRSAFRLAERLNTDEVISLLTELAESDDTQLAVFAINTLGKLRPAGLGATLSNIAGKAHDPEVLVAACRVMGQIGDPAAIEPLAKIVMPKRRLLRRKTYDTSVRVAAAYALAQMDDRRADTILQALKNDSDARVRQVVHRYQNE